MPPSLGTSSPKRTKNDESQATGAENSGWVDLVDWVDVVDAQEAAQVRSTVSIWSTLSTPSTAAGRNPPAGAFFPGGFRLACPPATLIMSARRRPASLFF
jgi:hypothetical protein